MPYGTYFCFTLNNPKERPSDFLKRCKRAKTIRGCVFQLEQSKSGTKHWQGYVETHTSRPFTFIKKFIRGNPHLESRKGTAKQAIEYCKKEDTRLEGPWEYGEFKLESEQGRRSDLEAIVNTMETATSLNEVIRAHPAAAIRYSRGIKFTYSELKAPKTAKVPDVQLFYGPSGLGKTRLAMCYKNTFKKSGSDPWFDGYDNQDTIILDDFAGGRNKMTLSNLLNYLDRYPVRLPVKGDFAQRNCSNIIITSNIHPENWYDFEGRETQYKALARRIHSVTVFAEARLNYEEGAYEQDHDTFFNHWMAYGEEDNIKTTKPVPLPWKYDEAMLLVPNTPPKKRKPRIVIEESSTDSSSSDITFL